MTAPIGMTSGAVAGGYLSDALGRRRTTALFLLTVVVCVVAVGWLDRAAPRPMLFAVAALYLSIGPFTAASYALFMQITDARLGATQFSAHMGATNACESWSAVAAGRALRSFGYPAALALMAVLSLLALPLLAMLDTGRQEPRDRGAE